MEENMSLSFLSSEVEVGCYVRVIHSVLAQRQTAWLRLAQISLLACLLLFLLPSIN